MKFRQTIVILKQKLSQIIHSLLIDASINSYLWKFYKKYYLKKQIDCLFTSTLKIEKNRSKLYAKLINSILMFLNNHITNYV